jgi:hypothetical protein
MDPDLIRLCWWMDYAIVAAVALLLMLVPGSHLTARFGGPFRLWGGMAEAAA